MPTGLSIIAGGWSGALGSKTCSIYMLDPSGTTALEPVADIVPGVSPLRVTTDTIDSEQFVQAYSVTRNTLQDLTDTTSHVRPELQTLTVTGVFGAAGPIVPGTGLIRLARFDLIRFNNLRRIAEQGRPVMVTTPRVSLARCFIVGLPTSWTPSDGDSLPITISFLEARVTKSGSVAAFADVDSMATGNNTTTGGGTGGSSSTSEFGLAAGPGVPPLAPV